MSHIFISYSHENPAPAAMLARTLEGHGWSVFWDRTIPAGKTWREAIGRELEEARCVIVLWTRASIKSHWVQEEADHARQRGVLVPILIENVEPPLGLRSIQAARLIDWDGTDSSSVLRALIGDIAAIIESSSKEDAEDGAELEREGNVENGRDPYKRTNSEETANYSLFQKLPREFRHLSTFLAGAAVAAPFLASFVAIAPPWPTGMAAITSAVVLVVLIVVYQTFKGDESNITRSIKWLSVVGLMLLVAYVVLFSMFTIYVPPAKRSIVIGYQCTAEALLVYKAKCPLLTIEELSEAVFDEFQLWTRLSITIVRVTLITGWLSLFVALAAIIGQCLILMRRKISSSARRISQGKSV
jgi:hypothetical protein